MARVKVAKTGKSKATGRQALRNLIISKPDSITVCSDLHVYIRRDFVRVTAVGKVFEIDVAADSVHSFPTSEAWQRDCAMVAMATKAA